ncbi:uncharacterized protein N7496_006439 [Penicillium cataractarum]|uniref:2EXR domain-containing protein n=1 Tax=Penicillium cataractarum TaxID=2100454 RepID=A0A9W9V6B1_9EURO|nr:uncharacterized protein N7496_006439 [Penicillium cataractarum]KAJ5370347.1 hypothetical protein N7496_006439 [Penicillium cataractarum]
MAEEFTLFPQLPPELRRMIWKACLPKTRIFDIMFPCYAYDHYRCRGSSWASRESWRPPVITRVCRESRAVAHETGRVIFQEDNPNVPNYIKSVWSDTTTDIIAQYWAPGLESVVFWDDPDPEFFHFAETYSATMISELRLRMALSLDAMSLSSDTFDWANLRQLRECFVCLEEPVMIHVSRKELLVSGLFGLLGEEYTQLVDPMDTETLKKFHHLALTSSQQLPETIKFFDDLSTPKFQSKIRDWTRTMMTRWIFYAWICADEEEYASIEYPEEVWLGPSEPGVDEKPFNPLKPDSYCYKGRFKSDQTVFWYNEKHPWVQQKLAEAPRFYPRIMIRPCITRCWLPRTPPRRGRARGHYRAGGR